MIQVTCSSPITFLLWRWINSLRVFRKVCGIMSDCTELQEKKNCYIRMSEVQCVPLANQPGISLIILPLMRTLQRLQTFLFISHTKNVLVFKFRCNISICVRIIKEMPGSVSRDTHCTFLCTNDWAGQCSGTILDLYSRSASLHFGQDMGCTDWGVRVLP